MRRFFGVSLFALLSLFCIIQPATAQAPSSQESGFELMPNYPNPFNPETTIPFALGEGLFEDGRPVVVSVRVFNLLSQVVAHPVALGHPSGQGVEVIQLEYNQPGQYEAFWDGYDLQGRQVASGMYFLQLTVNGETRIQKMLVAK